METGAAILLVTIPILIVGSLDRPGLKVALTTIEIVDLFVAITLLNVAYARFLGPLNFQQSIAMRGYLFLLAAKYVGQIWNKLTRDK